MGMGTMLDARAIVLIATGRSKSRALVGSAVCRPDLPPYRPASFLQLHPNVEIILDLAAAEKLPE